MTLYPTILTYYNEIKQILKGDMPRPRFVSFALTNACNQHCIGCAFGDTLNDLMVSKQDYFKMVNDFVELGGTAFDICGGGEPLILPFIDEALQLLIDKKCSYGIITNGTLLSNSLMNQIIDQASYIRFSLEASSAEEYGLYKRVDPNQWFLVLDNIKEMIKLKKSKKSACQISVKFSVSKSLRGINHYIKGIELGTKLGVDNIQFKALRHEPEELSLDDKIIENTRYSTLIKPDNCSCWIVPVEAPQCWLNPVHIAADYLGNVYICCYFYYRHDVHLLGNMLSVPLKDIWYNSNHWIKIKQINKHECAKVDCKFFKHHQIIEDVIKANVWDFI